MKDFDVFDIKEKWFKETAPQNYASGSTEGVPARTPSIVIDKANDALYMCAIADPTVYNTGWKKYVVDGGGGDYDYEFVVDVDPSSSSITLSPSGTGITLKSSDTVKVTLSNATIALLEQEQLTIVGTTFTGSAAAFGKKIAYTSMSGVERTISSSIIGINYGVVAAREGQDQINFNLVIYNASGGLGVDFIMSTNHTITITASPDQSGNFVYLLSEESGREVASSLDVAQISLSDTLKTILTQTGNVIDKDTFEVEGTVASSNIVIDTTAPSQTGDEYHFTIKTEDIYFDIGQFAHSSNETYTLLGYVGTNTSSYQPGVIIQPAS